jgi:hypothetical protein
MKTWKVLRLLLANLCVWSAVSALCTPWSSAATQRHAVTVQGLEDIVSCRLDTPRADETAWGYWALEKVQVSRSHRVRLPDPGTRIFGQRVLHIDWGGMHGSFSFMVTVDGDMASVKPKLAAHSGLRFQSNKEKTPEYFSDIRTFDAGVALGGHKVTRAVKAVSFLQPGEQGTVVLACSWNGEEVPFEKAR